MALHLLKMIGRAKLPKTGRRNAMRDERGTTLIEFGLLALPFFAIIGAITETSVVFLSGQILESAIQDTSRLIRTGQVQSGSMTEAQFRTQVCSRVYGLFGDCSGIYINVETVDEFNDVDVAAPVDWDCKDEVCAWTEDGKYVPGKGTNIVVVQAYYQWPLIMGLGSVGLSNLPNGQRLIGAVAVFRNEPFTS